MLQTLENKKSFSSNIKFTKRLSLIIPFVILIVVMVIIPLIYVFIITLMPTDSGSVNDNWSILDGTIFWKIFKSVYISIASTFFCILIAFPFCYFLSQCKSKLFKSIIFSVITTPMWLGSMIILISLKSFMDTVNGALNSTFGDIYTIIGIVYLYLPFMMIPLYDSLQQLPKNLINASKDLGRNNFVTFFRVILPHTKTALISGITLVLLPAVTVVAVPQFLNNNNDGGLIGDIIIDQGGQALDSEIALARACVLSFVVSILMFGCYGIIVLAPKLYIKFIKNKSKRGCKNVK